MKRIVLATLVALGLFLGCQSGSEERLGKVMQADGEGGGGSSCNSNSNCVSPYLDLCDSCDPMLDSLCVSPRVVCHIPNALDSYECGSFDQWCQACSAPNCVEGQCRLRGQEGDTCALGVDASCANGLYCSYASGECATLPRTDI